MRSYISIILLGLVSISLVGSYQNLIAASNGEAADKLVAIKKDKKETPPPHRGSGRREFFQSEQIPNQQV